MPADAPGMPVALRHHDLLAHLHRVEVDDLEGDMIDLRFEAGGDEQSAMVGRLVAAVEPHERPDRGSVREAHHVGRDEAQHVHIPACAAVEVGRLEHGWPSLVTCGGASAGRCVSLTRTVWFGAL